mgnify:CR=1 FL=1
MPRVSLAFITAATLMGVAGMVWGLPPDQVDRDLRARVKMVTYGLAYGLSAYGLARLVFDLAAGRIVDRLGERITAVIGLAVISLGSALTGMAPAFAMAVVAWAAAGVGSAIAASLAGAGVVKWLLL